MNYSVFKNFCQIIFVLLPIAIALKAHQKVDFTKDFVDIMLTEHNKYREKHGCQPLKWNEDIAKYAQEWAEENASINKMHHHKSGWKFGENLFKTSAKFLSAPHQAVGAWYSEIEKFNFSNPIYKTKAEHFSQLIWKGSREMGCGIAESKDNKKSNTYICCDYYPPGNMQGGYRSNVPALIKLK